MTGMRIFAAAALAVSLGGAAALAQETPARIQGAFAIGSCTAPDVNVTIDGYGMQVTAPDGSVITSVEFSNVVDAGGQITADVSGGESGTIILSDAGDGALDVIFVDVNGNEEPAQRLNLCQAAVVSTTPSGVAVPDELIGEFATGSCSAPDNRLVVGADRIEAFSGQSGQSQGVYTVLDVGEIPGGYLIAIDYEGTQAQLEMVVINQDIVEAAFIDPSGGREEETLYRCSAPVVISETPETGESIGAFPDGFLGRYVIGDDATCDAFDAEVYFEAQRLVVYENNQVELEIDVLDVMLPPPGAIEPAIDFVIMSDGREGVVEMRSAGGDRYALTFRNRDTGEVEQTETITLCESFVPEGPEIGPDVSLGSTIPDAYLGLYAVGSEASCADLSGDTVRIEPSRIVAIDNGQENFVVDVLEVLAVDPALEVRVVARGDEGVVRMTPLGADRYEVVFTESGGGSERPDIFTRCSAPEAQTPEIPQINLPTGDASDMTGFLIDSAVARFAALQDELAQVCQAGSEQACLDTFWAFADVTGDGLLTQAELARVTRFGAKWAVYYFLGTEQAGAAELTAPQLELGQALAIQIGTMVTGPIVADGLIYNYDYDGNHALSQVELFPDGVETAPIAMPALMQLFTENTLRTLFESLEQLDDLM
ncbi:MAG: hypothetical protein R3F55_05465 [Alphaproteobacteria bacterium]